MMLKNVGLKMGKKKEKNSGSGRPGVNEVSIRARSPP
jgi:hypothetical protein